MASAGQTSVGFHSAQERLPVGVVQFVQSFVQNWGEIVPGGIFSAIGLHSSGVFFAGAAASFRAPEINGDMNGGAMQLRERHAVQLACAVKLHAEARAIDVWCADGEQAAAARGEGLRTTVL